MESAIQREKAVRKWHRASIEGLKVAVTTKQYNNVVVAFVYRPFSLISFLSNGTYSKTLNKIEWIEKGDPSGRCLYNESDESGWIPAFAGMTEGGVFAGMTGQASAEQ